MSRGGAAASNGGSNRGSDGGSNGGSNGDGLIDGMLSRLPDGLRRFVEVLVQTVKDCFTDNVPQWAAAVAFYGLLSLFPFTLAAVSLAAYFVDVDWAVTKISDGLGEFLPRGDDVVKDTLRDVVRVRGAVSFLSALALLWTGSRVFGVLTMALNIAYDADETYGYFKRLMVEGLFMLTAGLLFFLALSSGVFLRLFQGALRFLPEDRGLVFRAVTEAVPGLLLLATYFLVYQYVPRVRPKWQATLAGAGAATLLFLVAQPLFLAYVRQFANYNLIYGSLGAVVILLVWAWVVALITLAGGELASHVHMMYFQGCSPEEVQRRHEERSPTRRRKGPPGRRAAPAQ